MGCWLSIHLGLLSGDQLPSIHVAADGPSSLKYQIIIVMNIEAKRQLSLWGDSHSFLLCKET